MIARYDTGYIYYMLKPTLDILILWHLQFWKCWILRSLKLLKIPINKLLKVNTRQMGSELGLVSTCNKKIYLIMYLIQTLKSWTCWWYIEPPIIVHELKSKYMRFSLRKGDFTYYIPFEAKFILLFEYAG